MMFMVLVLTAWQYRWKHVVFFTLAMAGLNVGLHGWFYRPGGAPFLPPLTAFAIETVSFLLVGYFISTLMNRLRAQNVALEQANAQLVHYSSTLEHLTISRERNRLARDLHDTLAHTLSALSVQLETVKAYFDVDSGVTKELIEESLRATRSGLTETRRALKSLRASPLDDLGLLLALRRMSEESADRAKMKLHLSLPDQIEPLSPDVEQGIYRVAQEAVANVVHHANARNLTLHLAIRDGRISLIIGDDGLGFDVEQGRAAGRFGLTGMHERAQLAGGELTIESRPGQGTTMKLMI
jgi:signal transduction histidine kinase